MNENDTMNKKGNVIKISLAIVFDIYVFIVGWLGLSLFIPYLSIANILAPLMGIKFGPEEFRATRFLIVVIIGLFAILLSFLSKKNTLVKVVRIVSVVLTIYMVYELIFTFITINNIRAS